MVGRRVAIAFANPFIFSTICATEAVECTTGI